MPNVRAPAAIPPFRNAPFRNRASRIKIEALVNVRLAADREANQLALSAGSGRIPRLQILDAAYLVAAASRIHKWMRTVSRTSSSCSRRSGGRRSERLVAERAAIVATVMTIGQLMLGGNRVSHVVTALVPPVALPGRSWSWFRPNVSILVCGKLVELDLPSAWRQSQSVHGRVSVRPSASGFGRVGHRDLLPRHVRHWPSGRCARCRTVESPRPGEGRCPSSPEPCRARPTLESFLPSGHFRRSSAIRSGSATPRSPRFADEPVVAEAEVHVRGSSSAVLEEEARVALTSFAGRSEDAASPALCPVVGDGLHVAGPLLEQPPVALRHCGAEGDK